MRGKSWFETEEACFVPVKLKFREVFIHCGLFFFVRRHPCFCSWSDGGRMNSSAHIRSTGRTKSAVSMLRMSFCPIFYGVWYGLAVHCERVFVLPLWVRTEGKGCPSGKVADNRKWTAGDNSELTPRAVSKFVKWQRVHSELKESKSWQQVKSKSWVAASYQAARVVVELTARVNQFYL